MARYFETQNIVVNGIDVYIAQKDIPTMPEKISSLKLQAISNRGSQVWPLSDLKIEMCDLYRCRYLVETQNSGISTPRELVHVSDQLCFEALQQISNLGFEITQFEKLLVIDGKKSFSEIIDGL